MGRMVFGFDLDHRRGCASSSQQCAGVSVSDVRQANVSTDWKIGWTLLLHPLPLNGFVCLGWSSDLQEGDCTLSLQA